MSGCFWVARVPHYLFVQLHGCSTSSASDGLAGRSSLAGSKPITPAAPGTSDVISLIAKCQHQLSLWDFVVTFCLAAVSTPHCCCRWGSYFWLQHGRVCLFPLPSPLLHFCGSTSTFCCLSTYLSLPGSWRREEGSSNPTASLSIWLEFLLNFPVCVLAMPLCFKSLKE